MEDVLVRDLGSVCTTHYRELGILRTFSCQRHFKNQVQLQSRKVLECFRTKFLTVRAEMCTPSSVEKYILKKNRMDTL